MNFDADTIVARATPAGTGGIGIVRVSGDRVASIAATMLGRVPAPRHATLSTMHDAGGAAIDRGIALFFEAPHSYTGEDVLELHAHGGTQVVSMLVDACVALGARRAEPGEFSRRAFLNERLDLAQAEAVADLIEAGTAQAARAALRSLAGEFSAAVNALVRQLTDLRVYVEAAIDFPDDDIDFLGDDELARRLVECERAFDELLARAGTGRVLRDGYRIVLVGKPNAGKSSLLNRLSGEDTAIVTEIAGTTRDILREHIDVDGLDVELVDTAGLRDNPDVIEKEGIRRAREAMHNADAVIWVQDATDTDAGELPERVADGVPVLIVRNKMDLPGAATADDAVALSARTGAGLDVLRERIRELAGYGDPGEGAFTARQRHVDALAEAAARFRAGAAALSERRAGELLAEELRLAQTALGRITGAVSADDLLGEIFASFCIGK
ncbi:MAG: tRNA uridine-5-carboxymethylaminomethyl(34) synthesis GTPase MnmE [Woeseiaceae bacterium]|nr:tRNA uridine-5-carboxymethylaminomethyl(34) synthesis GTPase MnmE [Woeseiaceae bacterium]